MTKQQLFETAKILIQCAKSHKLITYKELSNSLSFSISPRNFYEPLSRLGEMAEQNGFPKITSIVVGSQCRMPGDGFFKEFAVGVPEDEWGIFWGKELKKVYDYTEWDSFLKLF